MWSVYKSCLHARVKDVLASENFEFSWHIKGSDVKWNCEKVDNTGMVIPRAKSGILFNLLFEKGYRYVL